MSGELFSFTYRLVPDIKILTFLLLFVMHWVIFFKLVRLLEI